MQQDDTIASQDHIAGNSKGIVRRWKLPLILGGVLVSALCAQATRFRIPDYPHSAQFKDGHFQNHVPRPKLSIGETLGMWYDFLFKPADTVPDRVIPVQPLTQAELLAAPDNSVWRLGHSSLLLKLSGKFWLTDPVFSERASPVQWFGPKRWHEPPITLNELPPIEAVILSHNHYDHLDHAGILALQDKVGYFIAPLGVGATLLDWGVPVAKVRELDWWQEITLDEVRLVATPAQHFSGRGILDSDRSLWASWVIQAPGLNLFFSGDSGYFDGFRQIGKQYGPFDIAFLETGAYDKRWEHVHMWPGQTAQAFHDLGATWLFPIHNGTFDLGLHSWNDPFEQISTLAAAQGIALTTPPMGQRLDLLAPHAGSAWWDE